MVAGRKGSQFIHSSLYLHPWKTPCTSSRPGPITCFELKDKTRCDIRKKSEILALVELAVSHGTFVSWDPRGEPTCGATVSLLGGERWCAVEASHPS